MSKYVYSNYTFGDYDTLIYVFDMYLYFLKYDVFKAHPYCGNIIHHLYYNQKKQIKNVGNFQQFMDLSNMKILSYKYRLFTAEQLKIGENIYSGQAPMMSSKYEFGCHCGLYKYGDCGYGYNTCFGFCGVKECERVIQRIGIQRIIKFLSFFINKRRRSARRNQLNIFYEGVKNHDVRENKFQRLIQYTRVKNAKRYVGQFL